MRLIKILIISLFCNMFFLLQIVYSQSLKLQENIQASNIEALESLNKFKQETQSDFGNSFGKLINVRSPFTNQFFEVYINKKSKEYKQGILEIICPYTGKTFFIGEKEKEQKNIVKKKIRSPFTGKFFTAEIDLDKLFRADEEEQVIICPYTGKKFKFFSEEISNNKKSFNKNDGFQLAVCPSTKKYFKIYSKNGIFPKIVQSPYDGSIISIPLAGENEEKNSDTENIFNIKLMKNRNYKKIKQFGYNIFPKEKPVNTRTKSGNQLNKAKSEMKDIGRLLVNKVEKDDETFETTTFAPITSVPVADDYILGPGDTLRIIIWGKMSDSFDITIDREGKVLFSKIGPVYLYGQTFESAKKIIKKVLGNQYNNIDIDITMKKLRTIRVFVLGNAVCPGGYILSSRSTAFHAIFNALGVNKNGSMRNIFIKRKNNKIINIDLYDFILKGDTTADVRLEAEDVIFINPIGSVIGIAGAVKNPAIYEIKSNIILEEVIEMIGGFSSIADMQNIQVIRIIEGKKNILSISKDEIKTFCVKNGDLILIPEVEELEENYITLEGNVSKPGRYSFKKEMIVEDILEKKSAFLHDSYLKRVEIIRRTKQGKNELIFLDLMNNDKRYSSGKKFKLKEFDVIKVYSIKEIKPLCEIEIKGAVNNSGKYKYFEGMRITDLIFKAGGLGAKVVFLNAQLYREDENGKRNIYEINLDKIYKSFHDSIENKILFEGDLLIIRQAKVAEKRQCSIGGEVKYPGVYPIEQGDRLVDIIKRAGGFMPKAFFKGAVFTRKSLKQKQIEAVINLIRNQKRNIKKEEDRIIKERIVTNKQGIEILKHRKELFNSEYYDKLIGRILINLSPLTQLKDSKYNILLEDGDSLSIPSIPQSIQVIGSVYNQCSILFEHGKGINYYINKSGGFSKDADKKSVYIIKANGEVVSKFFKVKKLDRGDIIVVPEVFVYKVSKGYLFKDTVDILYKLALGTAVLANLD
jgi:protein involved in polysaccharide export with SLBB domain